jgi:hypothetical protein
VTLDITPVSIEVRTIHALERIATALEQMALERTERLHAMVTPTEEPPLPTPPNLPMTPIMQPLPPVQPAAPYQFTGPSASCPVHRQPWRTVPAGVSKKTGKSYSAFLVCPESGCEERPRA